MTTGPFLLLDRLYSDTVMSEIFSEATMVESWLATERSLARAQAQVGILTAAEAEAIATAATIVAVDLERLWSESRNVGYPILGLVRAVAERLPPGPDGRVHYGATTQDIMDTGLALQLARALARLEDLLCELGDAVAELVRRHRSTVMAARTHAQQAVPTTFGAKMATLLSEIARHLTRVAETRRRACVVSLFGAGGTSAAIGPRAAEVRSFMAQDLELVDTPVPWHVSRDGLAEFGALCAMTAATSARFAREVVDLSRTELGELREPDGHHRGASSTMPQKENPILCEAVIGLSVTAGALSSALYRAMEAGHERAAGEWQVEWHVIPQLATAAATCLLLVGEVAQGLRVFPESMTRNLAADGGLIMAEAYMMELAPKLGRERAHDLIYAAAQSARRDGTTLTEVLQDEPFRSVLADSGASAVLEPSSYIGSAESICEDALELWGRGRTVR